MKKLLISSLLGLSLVLTACDSSNKIDESTATNAENQTIIVGATSLPHAEILNEVVEDLAKEGINLEVKEFSEYTLLNGSLTAGDIDANFFQHTDYLNNYNDESGDNLISVGGVHIEPMGIYSKKIKSLEDLKAGDKVAIPNDATNAARALALLEDNGIIKVNPDAGSKATIFDIEENTKDVEIIEMDAASLPRTLDEVALAVINTNYVLEAKLNPTKDAIAIESKESDFANILVVRAGDEEKPEIKALYKALTDSKIKTFIEEKYEGAIIPAS